MPDKKHVSDVESLYTAVNEPGNAGATIVLAPGSYHLTRLNPLGAARLNGGRLELQADMSMSGVTGHRDQVVIDSSDPVNGPSFVIAGGNAGTIRMGRGRQTVEWLTVVGGVNSAAGIQTDLVGGTPVLRIARVVCTGSVRGIDVRNLGPAGAGRRLTVDLDDNEVTGNVTGNGQGIRFVNTAAEGASIVASLHGNRSHGNNAGFLAANQASNGASVTIDSHNDRFDDNLIGGLILGGVQGMLASTVANDNLVNLTMHAGSMARNRGVVTSPQEFSGGLSVVGGSAATAGSTSRNTVQVSIVGLKFNDNLNTDVKAWGARTPAAAPAGTNNTVTVKLKGVSAQAVTDRVDSEPSEPAGTNRATIVQ
jgi:hypothetical protein